MRSIPCTVNTTGDRGVNEGGTEGRDGGLNLLGDSGVNGAGIDEELTLERTK